jgi:hypothetical protein
LVAANSWSKMQNYIAQKFDAAEMTPAKFLEVEVDRKVWEATDIRFGHLLLSIMDSI